jgi:hypothetical protein
MLEEGAGAAVCVGKDDDERGAELEGNDFFDGLLERRFWASS